MGTYAFKDVIDLKTSMHCGYTGESQIATHTEWLEAAGWESMVSPDKGLQKGERVGGQPL